MNGIGMISSVQSAQLNVSITGRSSGSSASSVVGVTGTYWTPQQVYFQIGNESSVNLTISSPTISFYGAIVADIQMYQVGSGPAPFPIWAIVVCIVIPAIIIISVISVVIMKRGNHCAPDTDPELEVMKMKSNQTSAGKNNKTGGGSLAPTRLMTDADVQAHNERILVQ